MTEWKSSILHVVAVGVGATVVMDVWLLVLKRLDVPTLNFALVGRWIGHLARGRWHHESIGTSAHIHGELAIGWFAHYAIGTALAACMFMAFEIEATHGPTLYQALIVGVLSVGAPLLIMQPAMGAGLASAKTSHPWRNRLKSLATHTVFGAGLYLSANAVAMLRSG